MFIDKHNTVERDDYVEVALKRNGRTYKVLLDIDDVAKVINISWYINRAGYCIAKHNGKEIRLHNFILDRDTSDAKIVCDHINGNKLDNRRSNLRVVTQSVNRTNCKRTKGYSFDKHSGKFASYIFAYGKNLYLGLYNTEEEAKEARRIAESKYYNK